MEGEVSSMSKLAIVLIAVAILISLGFGIYRSAQGVATEGSENLKKEFSKVEKSAFSTYDKTIVTGNTVQTALSDFEGKNVAILVATKPWMLLLDECSYDKGSVDIDLAVSSISGSEKYSSSGKALTTKDIPIVAAYSDEKYKEAYTVSKSNEEIALYLINYNAILASSNYDSNKTSKYSYQDDYYMGKIYFSNNCFKTDISLVSGENGRIIFNNVLDNTELQGRTEYITSSQRFQSYLLKDNSGDIIGVVFIPLMGNN